MREWFLLFKINWAWLRGGLVLNSISTIHAALSSNNIVKSPWIKKSPHNSQICWIIDFNHIHSQLASWIVSIFEWFDDVSTIVCLKNLYEIALPLQLNTYPICDLALCGFERYHASVYQSNCCFDSLEWNRPILVVPRRYSNICLIPFQFLQVGVELHLTNKLIEKTIFGHVQLTRYITAPIALRYDTLWWSHSSHFIARTKWVLFHIKWLNNHWRI